MSVQIHPIPPVFDENSKILILGSFPSVKSRETRFFYGHPQNRFWKTLAAVLNAECPSAVDEKKDFLLSHKIAVWDVIKSCEISGGQLDQERGAQRSCPYLRRRRYKGGVRKRRHGLSAV